MIMNIYESIWYDYTQLTGLLNEHLNTNSNTADIGTFPVIFILTKEMFSVLNNVNAAFSTFL